MVVRWSRLTSLGLDSHPPPPKQALIKQTVSSIPTTSFSLHFSKVFMESLQSFRHEKKQEKKKNKCRVCPNQMQTA